MSCKDTTPLPISFLSSGALSIDHLCKPIVYKFMLFNQVKSKCFPCSVSKVHTPGG
ncbi:rCG20482 [Rattus norvegicus]|uniref:RCG20482 n=1 Tax=Rattus norvegicus TaxID=10116 RepID=A6JGW9_RAT|nr:rCG20482 [Rattus norvegicus]